jgi:general stress protein YciG
MANQQHGGGNFANDPQKASEAGKKGAEHRQQNQSGGGRGQQRGQDERASEAGRKGGQS